jgi:hypothetical protein
MNLCTIVKYSIVPLLLRAVILDHPFYRMRSNHLLDLAVATKALKTRMIVSAHSVLCLGFLYRVVTKLLSVLHSVQLQCQCKNTSYDIVKERVAIQGELPFLQ